MEPQRGCASARANVEFDPGRLSGENQEVPILVEVLYFDGCPNHLGAVELVDRVSRELRIEPEVRLVNVPDQRAARRLRFLGSPTIRVAGVDVDPDTKKRSDYTLACRIFQTQAGIAGQPDERWVREALIREAGLLPPVGGTRSERRTG